MERLIVLGTGNAQAIHCYNTCYAMQKGEEYMIGWRRLRMTHPTGEHLRYDGSRKYHRNNRISSQSV